MGQNGWLGWNGWKGWAGACLSKIINWFLVVKFLTRTCFNMLVNVGHVFHDGVCGHHVAYDIFPFFGGGGRNNNSSTWLRNKGLGYLAGLTEPDVTSI